MSEETDKKAEPIDPDSCVDNQVEQLGIKELEANDQPELHTYITWRKPRSLGLFYDKTFQSITHKLVATRVVHYPFFGVYLNTPGHRYSALTSIFPMFWSLKFFWGFLSDSRPIFGKNRIYYMALGWFISAVAYGVASLLPYPGPYYGTDDCDIDKSVIINEDAADSGMLYVLVMSVAIFGVGITDLASDALVVDYVKAESDENRGKSNVFAQMFQSLGSIIIFLTVGIMLNSPEYGGSFCDFPFTFQHILIIYFCISVFGFFNSSFLTVETKRKRPPVMFKKMLSDFWNFMQYKIFQRCGALFLMVPALFMAKSSAMVKIKKNWAKVDPMMGAFSATAMAFCVIIGLYILQRFFLKASWKKMFFITKVYIAIAGLTVEGITVFDVLRSQYFYFSEDLMNSVAHAVNLFIMLQLAAEVSEDGLEALTFGMLMTNYTISASLAVVIGNVVSVPFDVTGDERYISDTTEDRWMVFGSEAAVTFVNLLSIPVFLLLCPKDKNDVNLKKEKLGKSKVGAKIYLVCFCLGYLFIFVFNALIMIPSTQCLTILGGRGC